MNPSFLFKSSVLALGLILLPSVALAQSFNEKCSEIASCAKVVSEMLGHKYVFDADAKGKMSATSNLEFNKDNAELLFTRMLHMNGFTRIPLGPANTYEIARQRDAKDSAIPTVDATQRMAPSLPSTWDYFTLRYKATNPEAVNAISRIVRNFMPPNTRIMNAEINGTLIITDAAQNLRKTYDLIKELDQKPTAEMKKRWDEEEKARRAEKAASKDH